MSTTRSHIRKCIYENPGIHFNAISRRLDIATGQTQYHVRRLSRDEKIRMESIYGRTHYYPPTYSAWERGTIALLRRETAREIVLLVLRHDRVRPTDIADRLDMSRSTVEWHLGRLIERDVVAKERVKDGGQKAVVVTCERSSEVYRLLREIEPGLIDRLVDRFSRLTDELLDE